MSQASNAHQARLIQSQMTSKVNRPNGNYHHGEHQWGVIDAVNDGPPPSVDVYLDGAQNNPENNLTPQLAYLSSYAPTVGDVVLIYRGDGRNRTSRVVLGKLNGSATPYPVLLGSNDPDSGRYQMGPNALWGGQHEPPPDLGLPGDYYFRTDTPGAPTQTIYVNINGVWNPLATGSGSGGVSQLVAGEGITLTPPIGEGIVTIDSSAVTQLFAGSGISLSPPTGKGAVTIESSGVTQLVAGAGINLFPPAGVGVVTIESLTDGLAGGDLAGAYPDPILTNTANVQSIDFANYLNAVSVTGIGAGSPITLNPQDYALVDISTNSIILVLPTAPASLTKIGLSVVATNNTNVGILETAGTDTFFDSGTQFYSGITGHSLRRTIVWMYYEGVWYTLQDSNTLGNTAVGDLTTATAGDVLTWDGSRWQATAGSVGSYLPLAGGTMAGDINMGGHDITALRELSMTGSIDQNNVYTQILNPLRLDAGTAFNSGGSQKVTPLPRITGIAVSGTAGSYVWTFTFASDIRGTYGKVGDAFAMYTGGFVPSTVGDTFAGGSTVTLSTLSTLTLAHAAVTTGFLATGGYGTVQTTNGVLHKFTYATATGSTLTGCIYEAPTSDTLAPGAPITGQGYNQGNAFDGIVCNVGAGGLTATATQSANPAKVFGNPGTVTLYGTGRMIPATSTSAQPFNNFPRSQINLEGSLLLGSSSSSIYGLPPGFQDTRMIGNATPVSQTLSGNTVNAYLTTTTLTPGIVPGLNAYSPGFLPYVQGVTEPVVGEITFDGTTYRIYLFNKFPVGSYIPPGIYPLTTGSATVSFGADISGVGGYINAPIYFADGVPVDFAPNPSNFNQPGAGTAWAYAFADDPVFAGSNGGSLSNVNVVTIASEPFMAPNAHGLYRLGVLVDDTRTGVNTGGYGTMGQQIGLAVGSLSIDGFTAYPLIGASDNIGILNGGTTFIQPGPQVTLIGNDAVFNGTAGTIASLGTTLSVVSTANWPSAGSGTLPTNYGPLRFTYGSTSAGSFNTVAFATSALAVPTTALISASAPISQAPSNFTGSNSLTVASTVGFLNQHTTVNNATSPTALSALGGTLPVTSTAGWPQAGQGAIQTSGGYHTFVYSSVDATHFYGVTFYLGLVDSYLNTDTVTNGGTGNSSGAVNPLFLVPQSSGGPFWYYTYTGVTSSTFVNVTRVVDPAVASEFQMAGQAVFGPHPGQFIGAGFVVNAQYTSSVNLVAAASCSALTTGPVVTGVSATYTGQTFTMTNGSATGVNLTFTCQGVGGANTNLLLGAPTRVLAPGGSLSLIYKVDLLGWVETGFSPGVGGPLQANGFQIADGVTTNGSFNTTLGAGGPSIAAFGNTGDTQPIWFIQGKVGTFTPPGLYMGPGGNTVADTDLFRASAATWQANSSMQMGGFTGSNTTARWVGATAGGAPTQHTSGPTWTGAAGQPVVTLNAYDFDISVGSTVAITAGGGSLSGSPTVTSIAYGVSTTIITLSSNLVTAVNGSTVLGFTYTFNTGDWVTTLTGQIFICTAGGTPGTWVQSGGGGSATNYAPTGLSGATSASRYVGATTGGAPVTGTFVQGDYVVDRTGKMQICTVSGTPGTWVQSGTVAPIHVSTGLAGATNGSRWIGSTASGPPVQTVSATATSCDSSGLTAVVTCASGGTTGMLPGQVVAKTAGSGTLATGTTILSVDSLTQFTLSAAVTGALLGGATLTTYGTYSVGDWVTTAIGQVWVCTVAGSPGTWILSGNQDGWQQENLAWTRVSDTQFTISSTVNHATVLTKGTKVKWAESGTVKYGVVLSSSFSTPTTTVNLITTTDYVMAATPDAASTWYSYQSPAGFPTSFAWTPAITGITGAAAINTASWSVNNGLCQLSYYFGGTSNATTFGAVAPIACGLPTTTNATATGVACDNASGGNLLSATTVMTAALLGSGSTAMSFLKEPGGAAWTASNFKYTFGTLTYPI